jgi:hypothetical protein
MRRLARIPALIAFALAASVAACRGPRPDFTDGPSGSDVAAPAVAESPPPIRSYRCERASEPPMLEGTFEDGAWQRAGWTEEFVVVRRRGPMVPVRTRAKMLWDDAYLYCAVELLEPQADPEPGAPPQRHDVDLMLADDPERGGYQVELVGMGTVVDAWFENDPRGKPKGRNSWDARGLRTSVQRSRDGAIQRWTVVFALPWSSLELPGRSPSGPVEAPKPGAVWRVDLGRTTWRPMGGFEAGGAESSGLERAAWQPPADPAEPRGWGAVEFAP